MHGWYLSLCSHHNRLRDAISTSEPKRGLQLRQGSCAWLQMPIRSHGEQGKRPAISPHLDFLGELVEYEKRFPANTPTQSQPSETKLASTLLFDNCPWLKKVSMDLSDDVIPNTPRITNAASAPKAPWDTDDQNTGIDASTTAPAPAPVASATNLSQPAPRIVLAPVPKMGKRAKDQPSHAVRTSEPVLAAPDSQ